MFYYSKYQKSKLYEFATKMIHKSLADIICGAVLSTRIENLNKMMVAIKNSESLEVLLNDKQIFNFDHKKFMSIVNMDMYGRKCTKTLLMLMELKYHSDECEIGTGILSIEHILPQNPTTGSEWTVNYTPEQRNLYTHKIGNLCLITRKKNSSLGNLNYQEKKCRYFKGKIDTLPRTLNIITNNETWLPSDLEQNQSNALEEIRNMFDIRDVISNFDDVKEMNYIDKQKMKYHMAYEAWTKEEEARLLDLFNSKVSIDVIMDELGRNKGGIFSRLRKLGIIIE